MQCSPLNPVSGAARLLQCVRGYSKTYWLSLHKLTILGCNSTRNSYPSIVIDMSHCFAAWCTYAQPFATESITDSDDIGSFGTCRDDATEWMGLRRLPLCKHGQPSGQLSSHQKYAQKSVLQYFMIPENNTWFVRHRCINDKHDMASIMTKTLNKAKPRYTRSRTWQM